MPCKRICRQCNLTLHTDAEFEARWQAGWMSCPVIECDGDLRTQRISIRLPPPKLCLFPRLHTTWPNAPTGYAALRSKNGSAIKTDVSRVLKHPPC